LFFVVSSFSSFRRGLLSGSQRFRGRLIFCWPLIGISILLVNHTLVEVGWVLENSK
jgi:hypothetical protein